MIKEFKKAINLVKQTGQNLVLKSAGKPPRLYGLVFGVTDACNSRCRHCNIWRQKPTLNPLTPAEVEKIFKNPFFKDLKEVIITGGEALLRSDLEEIILVLHKYIRPDALISLSTNGLMPERAIKAAEVLVKNGIQTIVGVSLDGIGEKHDEIRGIQGNFKRVEFLLKELKKLKEKHKDRLSIAIGFTLSPWTVNSMNEVRSYAERLGLEFLPQVYEEASFYFNEGNIKATENKNMIGAIKELPSSFQKEVMLEAARGKNLKFRCSSMKTFLFLHCNGDIAPCLRYSHLRLGNLRKQSIEEIWQSKAVKEAREMIRNCRQCYNTWGVGWSMKAWFPPFLKLLLRTFLKKSK